MVLNIQGNQTEPATTIGRFGLEKEDPTIGIDLPEGLYNQVDTYLESAQSSPDAFYPELPSETSTEPSVVSQTDKLFNKKPKPRPRKPIPNISPKIRPGSVSPIDKILELNYLLEGTRDPNSKKSKILSGLNELTETGKKAIKGFMDTAAGGETSFNPAVDAWCAAFVAHVLSELGADPLKSKDRYDRLRADKYRNYGSKVENFADAKEGDIIVFDLANNDGIGDHVAFYSGERITSQGGKSSYTGKEYINVVGGNQGIGEVSIRENAFGYTKDKVLAIRRITYNDIDFDFTQEMAKQNPVFKKFIPEYASLNPNDDDDLPSFDEGGLAEDDQMGILGFTAQGVQQEVDKYVDKDAEAAKEITFKDAAKFVAELTPVIGDAMAAKEVYDELQKDDPNYLLAGALGGATIIGLIPGIGDAAAAAIRTGARKALDVAKRVEVDPDAVGMMGGSIRLAPKKTLDDFGYKEDNPVTEGVGKSAEDWLSENIEYANKSKNLLDGATTAFLGTSKDKPLFLDTDVISSLKGARGEVRKKGEPQYDRLKETVDKEGFDPNQTILIEVNHKGEAYIIEGNTRAALAKELDVPNIKAEIRYKNGAELVDGPFSPQNILEKSSTGSYQDALAISKKFDRTEDLAEAERLIESDELLEQWRKKEGGKGQRLENPAEKDAEAFYQGDITRKELQTLIDSKLGDPRLFTLEDFPGMPTITDTVGGMGTKARRYGILGVKGFDLKDGQRVGSRLDIPAYNEYDKWIVSIHDGTKDAGGVIGYGQAIRLKNIEFKSDPKKALDIARKKQVKAADPETGKGAKYQTKATIARIHGDYIKEDPYELYEQAKLLLDDPEWTQVGMNPYRGSFFYDKKTGMPVLNAEEIIQVGPLVLAKKVKTPKLSELKKYFGGEFKDGKYQSAARTKDGKVKVFNQGGTAMKDQMQMAFKDDGMTKDPVSGNEVPPGSLAKEVRDDIPAMLSEGEYVVPADVLRYYGVNFFENLRNQAKSGLQTMENTGRIGGDPMSPQQVQQNMSGQPMTNAPPAQPVAANTGPAMLGQQSQTGTNTATTGQAAQNTFAPMNFSTVGFSQFQQPTQKPTSVTSTKTYVNADNTSDTRIVTYVDGVVTPPADSKYTRPPYYLMGSPALAEAIKGTSIGGGGGGGGGGGNIDPPDPNDWAREITDPLEWAKENLRDEDKSVLELGMSVSQTRALAIIAEAKGGKENDDLAEALRKEARLAVEQNSLLGFVPEGGMNGTSRASALQKEKDLVNSIFGIKDKKIVKPKSSVWTDPDTGKPFVPTTPKDDDSDGGGGGSSGSSSSNIVTGSDLDKYVGDDDQFEKIGVTPSKYTNVSKEEEFKDDIFANKGGLMQRKKKKGK